MKSYLVCFAAFFLLGCSPESEVDKCTKAGMKSFDPAKYDTDKAEFQIRLMCLEAVNRKVIE